MALEPLTRVWEATRPRRPLAHTLPQARGAPQARAASPQAPVPLALSIASVHSRFAGTLDSRPLTLLDSGGTRSSDDPMGESSDSSLSSWRIRWAPVRASQERSSREAWAGAGWGWG